MERNSIDEIRQDIHKVQLHKGSCQLSRAQVVSQRVVASLTAICRHIIHSQVNQMLIELACQIPDPVSPTDKHYLLNGRKLLIEDSYAVVPISRQFNHGFPGISAMQLSLAICLELFGREPAKRLYLDFYKEHIQNQGHDGKGEAQYEEFTVLLDGSKYADLASE